MKSTKLIRCTFDAHGAQIQEIFNEVILNSTALYEYSPRIRPQIKEWFEAKAQLGCPVLGIEGPGAELQAFGTYGSFRRFPAFKYTAEHSIYVAHLHRGRGLGSSLLKALIGQAHQDQLHALIGAIDVENHASCRLHEKHGFKRVGTLPQVGYKFGQWLDLALYQLLLDSPRSPADG